MEPGTIEAVLDQIGVQAVAAIGALIPEGQALTMSFIVLAIVFLGLSLMTGSIAALGSSVVRALGVAAATLWVIGTWPQIVLGSLDAARAAIGLLIPGYAGPGLLFAMATDIAGRLQVQQISFSWSAPWLYPVDMMVAAIATILIWLGLSVTALLTVVAEFELLIASAIAPLLLPALAFGVTSSIGWAPVRFLVNASARVVVMGATAHMMGKAVTALVGVPGKEAVLSHAQIFELLGVAMCCAVVGFCINGLTRNMLAGGPGALGVGSIMSTGRMVASGVNITAGAMGGRAASTAGSVGFSSGRPTDGSVTRSSGTGSAFGT